MIKIFSIKEIVNASHKILNSSSQKEIGYNKKIVKHKKIIPKLKNNIIINEKMTSNETLILKNEIKDSKNKEIPDSIEKIIIEAEKKQNLKLNHQTFKSSSQSNNYNYQKVVDDLYILLKKQIKKNTLKLIVDLRNDIIKLDQKIISFKENEKKLNKNHKSLKLDINNLVNSEKKLKYELNKKKLDLNSLEKNLTKKSKQIENQKNINLEIDTKLKLSLNQNLQLENFNELLEEDKDKLKSQINKFQFQIKDLENKNKELNLKLNAFRNQNLQLENKNNVLEEDQNKLNLNIEKYQNQIKELEQTNYEANLEIQSLQKNNNLMEKDLNELKLKIIESEEFKQYKYKYLEFKQKNSDLENALDKLKVNDDKNHQNLNIITTLKDKIEFYQEENVRLGNELFETKKKFDISKSEIEKYEKEKSNLISKMNSVNEAINNSNILTNVFDNNVKPKINIINHNKIQKEEKKEDMNLNKMVQNIFSDNK